MSEKNFQRTTNKGLTKQGAHCTNHEGQEGVPDMSYGVDGVSGWIEFKIADEYPVRKDTPIKFKHPLTPQQHNFLTCRGAVSGRCWVMIRIERDYYIVSHENIKPLRDGVTRGQLNMICSAKWKTFVDYIELVNLLVIGEIL